MRIFFFLFSIIILTGSLQAQKRLSLEEAIQIALQKNPNLNKSENNIGNFEWNVQTAYGNFLPTLNAGGTFGWSHVEEKGRTINVNGNVFDIPASTSETRNYNADVSSNITLFDGLANFAALSQSKNDLESAKLALERLKQDIVFQTISLYYNVINAEQLLKVKEVDVEYNKKNLETIEARNKLGGVTLADLYAQQVQSGNADLALIQAKNDLETAKSNLLYFLGLDVLEVYEFVDTLTDSDTKVIKKNLEENFKTLSQYVDQALENRYDYKSALLNLESAKDGITIARSGHFPNLSGFGSFSTGANNINDLFDSKTYSVGLSLNIPIFSGWSVSNRVQFAEVEAKNSEIDLEDLKRQIKKDIQKTYLDLQAAEKALSVGEKNVDAARENLRIEQEKYNLGSGKLLDLLIANSNYTNAQTNYIDAEFSYVKLSEQLKYYLGVLDYKKYE